MKLLALVLFVGLVSTSLGNPEASVSVRQRRDANILANSKQHIQHLTENLQKYVQHAKDSVGTFAEGIQRVSHRFNQRVMEDLQNLRNGFENSVQNIVDRVTEVGPAVKACVEKQYDEAKRVFSHVHENSKICANQDIGDIQNMIDKLSSLSDGAVNYTKQLLKEMEACNRNSPGVFHSGACFGNLVVKTDYNNLIFATQSSTMISKINLSLLTLPAATEVCAGRSFLSATSEATAIMSEIASCSFSTMFNSESDE